MGNSSTKKQFDEIWEGLKLQTESGDNNAKRFIDSTVVFYKDEVADVFNFIYSF